MLPPNSTLTSNNLVAVAPSLSGYSNGPKAESKGYEVGFTKGSDPIHKCDPPYEWVRY